MIKLRSPRCPSCNHKLKQQERLFKKIWVKRIWYEKRYWEIDECQNCYADVVIRRKGNELETEALMSAPQSFVDAFTAGFFAYKRRRGDN
jgi:hypothetical protein